MWILNTILNSEFFRRKVKGKLENTETDRLEKKKTKNQNLGNATKARSLQKIIAINTLIKKKAEITEIYTFIYIRKKNKAGKTQEIADYQLEIHEEKEKSFKKLYL